MPNIYEGQFLAEGKRFGLVVGRFNNFISKELLGGALDCIERHGGDTEAVDVVWVPGAMEVPLALNRLLARDDIQGAACLGIIEKGHTQHGLAMGQSVMQSIIDLHLTWDNPVGLGIIGPGAEPEHIGPRLEPHARAAVAAISAMV